MTSTTSATMEAMVSGRLSDDQIEAFLLEVRSRGETAEDLVEAAGVMRRFATPLSKSYPQLLDTCGTGGDGKHTLNVSTIAAIAVSAAGVAVAKHGNRSVSSLCGSADLLELLGVTVDLTPDRVEHMIAETNFGFFFAPKFHPATRYAMNARKKIKGKTLFNLLGPLANPAGAGFQLLGVYEERLVGLMAEALRRLGTRKALVVHGKDGLDEISLSGETFVAELSAGVIRRYTISPESLGFKRASLADLQCETKEDCKASALEILRGTKGPKADIVCLNAAAALVAADQAKDLAQAVERIRGVLERGLGLKKLEDIVRASK